MIAAVVLAGGQARRMGGCDKPLLHAGGRTMLRRILDVLEADHSAVAISANGDPARFGVDHPVLRDAVTGAGPLAGVLAGLEWAKGEGAAALLTVPGDTPLIPPGLAAALAPAPAVAESGGRRHHLVALWPAAAAESLRQWLSLGQPRRVGAFAATLGMRGVPFAGDPFLNVNTPAELEALEARLAGRSPPASI